MMTEPTRDMDLDSEDSFDTSHVRARTMPAPPLEERERKERKRRKWFVMQCVAVLLIGTALYCCFGGLLSRGIGMLFGLRHNSWFRESLICGSLVLLPLIPIIRWYFRRNTQTPRS